MNDIADATIAVQKELGIGRSKTCAFGASYGGYAALGMAYKHSDLYECVAGGMGVYDMKILRDGSDDSIYTRQDSYEETAEKFWGDDEDQLVDFSPVFNADKMNSRILMWHGLQDPISPIVHPSRHHPVFLDERSQVCLHRQLIFNSFTKYVMLTSFNYRINSPVSGV